MSFIICRISSEQKKKYFRQRPHLCSCSPQNPPNGGKIQTGLGDRQKSSDSLLSNGDRSGRHRSRSGWLRNSFSKAFSSKADKRSGGGKASSKGGSVSDVEDGLINNRVYREQDRSRDTSKERPSSGIITDQFQLYYFSIFFPRKASNYDESFSGFEMLFL